MTVETASYISQLDDTLPLSGDKKREGDNHIRLVKDVLKTQFPNFGTAAMNATTTELNYVVGVTSAIQAQINAKATKAGDTYTGAQDFTGATVTVPTATAGDATTKSASTAFVAATAFSAALPGQAGNAGKFVTTDGANASWAWPELPAVVITTNTTGVAGVRYIIGAPGITLTAPTSWVEGDPFAVSEAITGSTYSIDFGATKVRGVAIGLVTIDASLSGFSMQHKNATLGLI